MRWPWQRPERPVTDAPAPTRPAGWAFLPPLQRQVADAPPATLRPAFVSTLPTRAVPASLGSMGHLVDDTAPSGTVAVDDRTLGIPVQRAVATDLTLLPRPVTAAPVRPVAQRVDDSASLDSPVASPMADPEVEAVPDATAPALAAEPAESVPTLADGLPTAADPASPRRSASAAPPSSSLPPGAPSTTPQRDAPAPFVRPTLQRSSADSPPIARAAASPSVTLASSPSSIRRPGLGAPLPPRSLQRSTEVPSAAGAAVGPSVGPREAARREPTPADSSREPEHPADSAAAPEQTVESPAGSVQREREEPGRAPLLGTSPLESPLGSAAEAPFGDHARDGGRPESSGSHPQAGPAPVPPAPALPVAVQRALDGDTRADTDVVDAYAQTEAADSGPDVVVDTTTAASAASAGPTSTGGSDRSTGLPGLSSSSPVQRTVPLFGVQRLTPSISAPSHVPARRVVVARALAPEPPPVAAHAPAWNASGAARTSSSTAGAAGDANTATGWTQAAPDTTSAAHTGAGADLSLGWPPAEASVSRLVEAPSIGRGDPEPPAGLASTQRRGAVAALQRAESTAPVGSLASRSSATTTAASDAAMPVVSRQRVEQAALPRMPLAAASPGMDVVQRAIDATVQRAETATPVSEAPVEPAEPEASVAEPGSTGGAHTSVAPAPPAPAGENVEQLARKLYGPLVRRIKAELLLDRERRGIRIDGI
ncbi:hypothetical protein [Agromyces ramosus]|uniref:DNA polymerase-3 subunit gamma/tau n=1 Tax=Agromyces ramosus TaxID=33879 RepID=A0ABU0R997_9MICO|nr:hypothetical protein [Agromyces ramosus]MDQ0894645.1 hypothetical protein [Agromyces ramosus]